MEKHAKKQIKYLLFQEDVKIKDLAERIGDRLGKKYYPTNLSHKLNRSSVSYDEMVMIADILGYDIKFERREPII